MVKVLAGRELLGPGVALASGESTLISSSSRAVLAKYSAQAMYSLSQDNLPFKRAILSQPHALEVLVTVITDSRTSKDTSTKGKEKGKQSAEAVDGGRALLLRLLVAGEFAQAINTRKCSPIRGFAQRR